MKRSTLFLIVFLCLFSSAYSNGVMVVDAGKNTFLKLNESIIQVQVENQVAITTATLKYHNNLNTDISGVFAFPLPPSASAIGLRWCNENVWYDATISAKPQDSSLPSSGGTTSSQLTSYLGTSPLFFNFKQQIKADSDFTVILSYVQFLDYELGNVYYSYPNNYSLIQPGIINRQSLSFILKSQRTIDSIYLYSHPANNINNDGHNAVISFENGETPAAADYKVRYKLSSTELGLFGFSNYKDSVPDNYGRGYLLFVAEPDASTNTASIPKVFTLIIDRSGSMGESTSKGNKIDQAKNAAKFIVNNLNEGDQFNIVSYDDVISTFRASHVPFNLSNKYDALKYIDSLYARNLTDIGQAFAVALNQYPDFDSVNANIILFFTDGLPTAGITGITELLNHISKLNLNKKVVIFPFGVGNDVDKVFLSKLADQNGGIADFLMNDELEAKIEKFYLLIRNPVLLNSKVAFNPPIISEIYPSKLPNLYKGQQMMVTGRYAEPASSLNITLSGTAFGKPVAYTYNFSMSDSADPKLDFLGKVWAKMKIEDMLIRYYMLTSGSNEAKAIKDSITDISVKYGIITVFTSYTNDNGGGKQNTGIIDELAGKTEVSPLSASPNPFSAFTVISLNTNDKADNIILKIYDIKSNVVAFKTVTSDILQQGYRWDGNDMNGSELPAGAYIVTIEYGNNIYSMKIIKF